MRREDEQFEGNGIEWPRTEDEMLMLGDAPKLKVAVEVEQRVHIQLFGLI